MVMIKNADLQPPHPATTLPSSAGPLIHRALAHALIPDVLEPAGAGQSIIVIPEGPGRAPLLTVGTQLRTLGLNASDSRKHLHRWGDIVAAAYVDTH